MAILEAKGLGKSFGAVVAAKDIEVSVEPNEIIGIIGANGAGKTTFVNMVTGYLKPSTGRILFEGNDITDHEPRTITRLGICRSFQVAQVFMTMSVFQNLLIAIGIAEGTGAASFARLVRNDTEEKVWEVLKRFQIDDYAHATASTLPQGVRKLLDIAMAMVASPRILLLDEPTSGISVEEKFGLMDIVMDVLKREKVTVLFVEHDMEIVARYVSRVIAFYQGEIICDAPPDEALVDPKVKEFVIGEEYHRRDAAVPEEAMTQGGKIGEAGHA